MRQHDPQGFQVTSLIRATVLDQCRELQRRLDQCVVLEEQLRYQRQVPKPQFRAYSKLGRVKIEKNRARERSRFMPVMVLMTSWHEDKLSVAILQRRPR